MYGDKTQKPSGSASSEQIKLSLKATIENPESDSVSPIICAMITQTDGFDITEKHYRNSVTDAIAEVSAALDAKTP